METKVIIGSILFIAAGILFLIAGVVIFLRSDVEKNSGDNIHKKSARLFFLIGLLTVVSGLLGISFRNEITRVAFLVYAVIYLAVLTVIISVYSFILGKENERNNSSR